MRKFFSSTVAVFSITAVILLSGNSVFAQGQGQGQGQGGQQQSPWLRTGNVSSGQSDYLGYQDAAPLIFKTTSAERMKISATGEVSIGVSSTVHKFEVAGGNSKFGGDVLVDGNMGIGTTSPLERLEVMLGNVKFHNDLDVLGIIRVGPALPPCICGGGPPRIEVNGGMRIQSLSGSGNVLATANDEGILSPLAFPNNSSLFLRGDGTFGSIPTFDWTVSGSNLYMIPNGNVGIGTSNVTEKLTVQGNAKLSGNLTASCVNTGCLNVSGQTSFEELNVNTKIKTARIVPLLGDSIIHLGDSTIDINVNSNKITFTASDESVWLKGLSIGNGPYNYTGALNSFALGYNVATSGAANNSFVIGKGSGGFALTNIQPNSLWVGFESNLPTFVVSSSSGPNTLGNVGVGTWSPQARLHVYGDSYFDGNIGIGTTTFSEKLNVNGNGLFSGKLGIGTSSTPQISNLWVNSPSLNYSIVQLTNNISGTNPLDGLFICNVNNDAEFKLFETGDISFLSGDPGLGQLTGKMVIKSSGNVGIGMPNPQAKLHVTVSNDADNALVISKGTGEKFIIKGNGNVGVGTSDPQAEMEIYSSGSFSSNTLPVVRTSGSAGAGWRFIAGAKEWAVHATGASNTQGADKMVFKCITDSTTPVTLISTGALGSGGEGRVGIGTFDPQYMLDVAGIVRMQEGKVCMNGCDFVFENNYNLLPLVNRKNIVPFQKHLPNVKSAADMQKNGAGVSETMSGILQNVEEHELYLYDHDEKINTILKENKELKKEIGELRKSIEKINKAKEE